MPFTDVDEMRAAAEFGRDSLFVLSVGRWRRFLTFVSQLCGTHKLCFTLTLKVSCRQSYLAARGLLAIWSGGKFSSRDNSECSDVEKER